MKLLFKIFLSVTIALPIMGSAQIQVGSDINGEAMYDNFGKLIKLSANGSVLGVISNGTNGKVFVYKNEGGNWGIYGTDADGEHFNNVVASGIDLSYDGNTLALGGGGVSRVYTYDSGIWTQKGNDIPNSTTDSSFGTIVNLSNDGNTIAVSSPTYVTQSSSGRQLPPPIDQGMVEIFIYESGNWNQIGNSIIGYSNEFSGHSISLSSDGTKIAISNRNSVKIYENMSGVWTILGNEISGVYYEHKQVSLSSDGTLVVIGDPQYSDGIIQRGRVRIYQYISNNWIQIGNDILGQTSYEFAGEKVSMSSNGNIVAVSFNGNYTIGNNVGQVRIYKNESGNWNQIGDNFNGESSDDKFGTALSLSKDASTVAIGTPFNDNNGTDAGYVKVYDLSTTLSNYTFEVSQFKLFPNPATNQFTIQIPQGSKLLKVNMYTLLGQLITSTQKPLIQTKSFPKGIYLIEIETDKGKASKKLVIQ